MLPQHRGAIQNYFCRVKVLGGGQGSIYLHPLEENQSCPVLAWKRGRYCEKELNPMLVCGKQPVYCGWSLGCSLPDLGGGYTGSSTAQGGERWREQWNPFLYWEIIMSSHEIPGFVWGFVTVDLHFPNCSFYNKQHILNWITSQQLHLIP